MRKRFFPFIQILLCLIIISCSDSNTNNNLVSPPVVDTASRNNFKYPYNINSFWYYTTKNFVTNLRPDSLGVYFSTDTLIGYGDASFERDTILNQDTVRLLRNSHSEPQHSHTTLEYYKQAEGGLIRIAYYSDGINFGPYRSKYNKLKYSVNGKSFRSVNEIFDFYKKENSVNGKLVYDDPPITAIKYPIVKNEEWDFVSYGTTRITKKFIDFETVNSAAGSFYCIKIQRNWYYNSPNPDTNYISYDYFSKEGMIKRDFRIKDILISNQSGTPIGYIDVKEEDYLNLYNLP